MPDFVVQSMINQNQETRELGRLHRLEPIKQFVAQAADKHIQTRIYKHAFEVSHAEIE